MSGGGVCQECKQPGCQGLHELRKFESWTDLAAHLDEEDILRLVNHLHEIGPEYVRLKDKEDERKAYNKQHMIEQRLLKNFAEENLTPDELQALKTTARRIAEDELEGKVVPGLTRNRSRR